MSAPHRFPVSVSVDMCSTCEYHGYVGKMIQIRHVPAGVHRQLKARAALTGKSLSEYLLGELRRTLERPTRAELLDRLGRRSPVRVRDRPANAVRAERAAR